VAPIQASRIFDQHWCPPDTELQNKEYTELQNKEYTSKSLGG